MTTKTISGTYSAGYLLNGAFSTVDITASGSVGGFGLLTNGNSTIQNYGHLLATLGSNGVTMGTVGGGNGYLFNHAGSYIRGGLGIAASGAGASGNSGGSGAFLTTYGFVNSLGGYIVGGGGSAGVAGAFGGDGGHGGAGVNLHFGGELSNDSSIFGGSGGAGGASSNGTTTRGGMGGGGGAGVYGANDPSIYNLAGGLFGGSGGHGGAGGAGIGGYGGVGGAGVEVANNCYIQVSGGFVEGGAGGAGGSGVAATGGGGTGGVGILLHGGGYLSNRQLILGGTGGTGVNGQTSAYQQIGSGGAGVFMGGVGGTVSNLGVISGGSGGVGAGTSRGGIGGSGIDGNGTIWNYSTIVSGAGAGRQLSGYGIHMSTGVIFNGSALDHTATIEGRVSSYGASYTGIGIDVALSGDVTIYNYGTISGGMSIVLGAISNVLVVEAGCVFSGGVNGGGGTLEFGAGSGTVSGIDINGNVAVTGFASSAPVFQNFNTLLIESGGNFALASGATVGRRKALVINGQVNDAAGLTVTGLVGGLGTLSVTGKLTFQNKSLLSVADLYITGKAAKVTMNSNLTYGGVWFQTNGSLAISAGRTLNLTNAADVISGKGVTVSGALKISGSGKLQIQGPVANNGLLIVSGGTLVLENNSTVTGTGSAQIIGGTFDASGNFNQAVTFVGGKGVLILGRSQFYTANISGFSTTGGTSFDLSDVGFVSASEATFSGTTAGGVLTVTDGTHTAKLNLVGNFTGSTFTASSDGHGGVIIVDPTTGASAPPASAQAFVAAMAGIGGGVTVSSGPPAQNWQQATPMLVAPQSHMG